MKGIKVKNIKIDFNKVVINKKFDDSLVLLGLNGNIGIP